MTLDRARLRRIFDAACDLDAAARGVLLDRECTGDPELRAEVEELLRRDQAAALLAEERLAALRGQIESGTARLPERIGRFRVLARIGAGGMGVVYRALQENPEREVAIKVLAPGLGDDATHARFALEAEALGRLQHPGIAQILEAGSYHSEHGEQPYLAMELVGGEALNQWARRRQPAERERLAVLLQVCDAIQHAHQKGLIHRDLKPGNLLVDESARVKVLDFGIARLLDADRDHGLRTRTGQMLGTLSYMSPEQAKGDHDAVDVRSDVYALGVIAYELLSGALPIDVEGQPLTVAVRRVIDDQPVLLGQRDRRIATDLQTIVATALRKEPERRYATVQAFADDLRRYLAYQPVLARPASFGYVVRRFARRHRGLVVGSAAAVLALCAGTALAVAWALRAARAEGEAREEAKIADGVSDFVEHLFAGASPAAANGREITAKELVLRGVKRVGASLADEPLFRARLERFLGTVLTELGEAKTARPLLDDALTTLRASLPADDTRIGEAILSKARNLFLGHDVVAAEPLFDEALAWHERMGRPRDEFFARCHEGLGACALERRGLDEALAHFETMRAVRAADPDPAVRARDLVRMANLRRLRGETQLAEMLFVQAHQLAQQGDDAMLRANLATNLGVLRAGQQRLDEAESLSRESLEVGERLLGVEHPLLVRRLCNLAGVLSQTGRQEQAVPLLERALAIGAKAGAEQDDGVASAATNLGNLREQQGRSDDAVALYERAIAIYERFGPARSRELADTIENMALAVEHLGDKERAAALRERVAAIRGR
ncbi:MAG: protein kinase [Planctomycetota bacterium]